MTKEILISVTPKGKRVAVTKDARLEEFYVESNEQDRLLGNIYKGRVESVVPSLDATFVDIGQGKNGFLYLSEIESPLIENEIEKTSGLEKKVSKESIKAHNLKSGQEIWVQVTKDAFSTKGPRLTTHISLPGRYLVLMPFEKQIGISRRIEDRSERGRLRGILEKTCTNNKMGFIVRTASSGKNKRDLLRDANQLIKLWKNIRRFAHKKPIPFLIYKEMDLVLRTVRDYFTDDVTCVLVDSKVDYGRIHRYARTFFDRKKLKRIQLYKDKIPLLESKKIENEIGKIYGAKVFLKSGASIIIEKTEGLIVIDVNSGKFKSKSGSAQTSYLVNLEAAKEVARQLRLRDYSGIIVIDFIDMANRNYRKHVSETLKEALSADRAKTEVMSISKLGLVEMTRERTGKPVESSYFKVCPYCGGSGKIKND